MAKQKVQDDRTPEQRLKADWPAKHKVLAPYVTMLGRFRTGLKPSELKIAHGIRKRYGFE